MYSDQRVRLYLRYLGQEVAVRRDIQAREMDVLLDTQGRDPAVLWAIKMKECSEVLRLGSRLYLRYSGQETAVLRDIPARELDVLLDTQGRELVVHWDIKSKESAIL
jgi:hypothetical protein